MEPLDPAKDDESSGFSKRRISSILKAPRNSIRFPDPEQQQNVVECAKPVEKRISRRVSFAPANDVLLFSKDAKNASPVRSPLQELLATTVADTQNGVQVVVTEDGNQQIAGMETLLKAPLHASQQMNKVNFDTRKDFGEKTVLFSTDDAFMDMTHSHTINIANDADISLQNYDVLHTGREKTVMFTADDGSMDMTLSHTVNMTSGSVSRPSSRNIDLGVEKRNISPSELSFDPGFESIFESLSKPSGYHVNPVVTRMMPAGASSEGTNGSLAQIKTQRADVDKENQAPTFVSAVMEKSLNASRKIGELSYGSALCPEDDVSMDMTEVQTGRIRGFTDDDDPFQCLFPTQEMYSHLDSRVSQTAEETKQQQSSKTLASFHPKDMTSLKNPSLHASHQRHGVNHDTKDDCREKTIMFTVDDEFMDMTRSHTVNIARGQMDNASSMEERKPETCGPLASSANGLDPEFKNFLASLSQTSTRGGKEIQPLNTTRSFGESCNGGAVCPDNDVSMEMTEAQTGQIKGLSGSDDPFQCLFPTQDMYPHCESLKSADMTSGQRNSGALGSSDHTGMEPSWKPSLKTMVQRQQVKYTEDDYREKTLRFSADDACMDVTQCLTVNISSNLVSDSVLPVKKHEGETCGLLTNRSSSAHGLDPGFKNLLTSLSNPSDPSVNSVMARMAPTAAQTSNTGDSSQRGTICSQDDVSMDMTEAQTGRILAGDVSMDMTEAQTGRILGGDVSMDMTETQTGHILGIADTVEPPQCVFPTKDMYPQSGHFKKAEMTSQPQHGDAIRSSNCRGMETSLTTSLKKKLQGNQVNFDVEDNCREKTVRFTADDACVDMTRSHTVNIVSGLDLQSQHFDFLPAHGEKTVRFTASDAAMDVTRSHTVNISSNFGPQSQQNVDFLPTCGEKTVRFTASDAAMDVTRSHTVNISSNFGPQSQQNLDFLPTCGEKTVRFTASDAAMDVTRSHTVNISSNFGPQSQQNVDFLPPCGEKTVRFTASDATMDVTRSHTVNISSNFGPQSQQNVDFLPTCGEKTVRFTASDATMDVTRSHTVNISSNFGPQSQQNLDFLPPCGEKTVRFTASDATMDVTRSHTVNIATDFATQSRQNADFVPTCGEKTVRFTTNDAAMDVTRSHTINIATDFNIFATHENMDSPLSVKKIETETYPRKTRSSAHALDQGFKKSLSSDPCVNPVETKAVAPATPSPREIVDTNGFLKQIQMQKPDVDAEREPPGFVSTVMKKPVNKTMTDSPEDDVNMDMTVPKCGLLELQTCPYKPPEGLSSTKDLCSNSDYLKKTEVTSQQSNEALVPSNSDHVEIPKPLESWKDSEPRNQTCSLSQKMESSPTACDFETAPSRKSRRMSLADLHSKVRRLSHMINTAPDTIAMDSRTAPLPPLEHDKDKNSRDKTISLPVMEPHLETSLVNTEENTQAQCHMQEEQPFTTTTTPFNLKTKQLMSRLSVGGFKAKLPQRSKPDDPKKANSVGQLTSTITVNVTNQLTNFDGDVSDIYDEELGSCEDISEMLDTRSLQKATELVSWPQESHMDEPLQDDVFEQDFISATHGKKRPSQVDKNILEDEKRMKASTEMATDVETGLQSYAVECDSNISAAPSMTAQTTDYTNSSHTASIRCEATFESTFKQSLFESQLEDYASEVQRKLDDGTITVLEFFKLFNIDFVIHNPRQSVLPGRLLSDTDRTPMDLLKDRHINRPKHMVYETDVLNLTEKVEGLKERMRDLDKPLKIVNRPLWEEIRNSSEKELKSFGAKLKERNNLFRKTSKVQSHEMKEVLYSDLVQANLEEQQRLRGRIEEADEMIKSLDDCIHELETEIAAVEEKGFEDKPSLKSCQEEMQKSTEALADNDRQTSELELQKKHNSHQLNRLKAETRNLESHMNVLHMVNEWKFVEKRDNCSVYTFLHETFHLQLLFDKSNGNDADNESEKKISHITFKLQLDEEKSQGHACLVHRLLSQYIEGEGAWVEKYPTGRHVPKLLHDVALVVSRCRLLGEELRLLKMWGALRLDILNISCVDAEVHIVFSSLKKCSKFEVIFSVSLTNHLCVLQVQDFRNMIGSTTIQQIEEIVASFIPGKNLLTKIVKKIHANLLC